jgi:hypothetical protein
MTCSADPITEPCSESHQSNPYYSIPYFGKLCFNIIPPNVYIGTLTGDVPSGFPTQILLAFIFIFLRATCPAHHFLSAVIIEIYLVKHLIMHCSSTFHYYHSLQSQQTYLYVCTYVRPYVLYARMDEHIYIYAA